MRHHAAPVEGITGFVFRDIHHRYLLGVDKYYSPFIAPNQNRSFSLRERRGILSESNGGMRLIPQILMNRSEDFMKAALDMETPGYEEVNLNLGCPSKTVVAKGRGSGFLVERGKLCQFLDETYARLDMKISVKTGIGKDNEEEWPELLEFYNRLPMEELIVHPGTQQDYCKNVSRWEAFGGTLEGGRNPVCYNGDISTTGDFGKPTTVFPKAEAVMLECRPTADPWPAGILVGADGEEDRMNEEADVAESRTETACEERLRAFHSEIYTGCEGYLSGDGDVLFRMKGLWFYLSCLFRHSGPYLKKIRKSSHSSEYRAVMDSLFLEQPLTVWAGSKPQGRSGVETKREAIAFCKKLAGVYKDYPFHDDNRAAMRHWDAKETFAYIFEGDGHIWVNMKCDAEWRGFWRAVFPPVVPGFHLNKTYWSSIILDGDVPERDTRRIVMESYDLTKKR